MKVLLFEDDKYKWSIFENYNIDKILRAFIYIYIYIEN
jgi:hypothetical protein